MSDKKTQLNRIPYETITQMDKWALPSMGEGAATVSSVKQDSPARDESRDNERIEDVTEPVEHKPLTAEQLNQITEEAEKEGYQAGFDKGLAEGFQQGKQQGEEQGKPQAYEDTRAALEEQRSQLHAIYTALMDPVEQQDNAVEKALVDIAVGLAKHLLLQELSIGTSNLYPVVHKALAALPMGAKNIRIFLHPDDIAILSDSFANGGDWQLMADTALHRGGCRVESSESLVDYSVENRLRDYLSLMADQADTDAEPVSPVPADDSLIAE